MRRTTTSALERARRAWRGTALVVRGEARARGVRGGLEYLDEQVGGKRGRAAPAAMLRLAEEMRAARMPEAVARAAMEAAARQIVEVAYTADTPPRAA